MFKYLLFFLSFILIFPLNNSYAQEKQFDISVDAEYDVDVEGVTTVTQNVTVKNKTDYYYTPSYTTKVGFSDVSDIEAFNAFGSIPATFDTKNPENKSIKLSFDGRTAGRDKLNEFVIRFKTKDVAKKQGNIWEVTIPGIDKVEDFENYTAKVSVPDSFGERSIIKPYKKNNVNSFSKNEIGNSGIYILYGDKQYYSYELNYNISNPNLFPVKTEITLPPTTNYQNVLIKSFSEAPLNVKRDFDGNFLAEFKLGPQEKKTIVAKGFIEVLGIPGSEELDSNKLKEYLQPKKYWDSKDRGVLKEAENLEDAQDIYNFVKDKLSYNYQKIAKENLRLGGKKVLDDPTNSVCLEFTDLFVTLARAKGIPARAVEGYAYTTNSKLRPLSLVSDVLHAWPEYYDREQKKWIMVDPTWGNTTNGLDYFKTLDFSHVAFVIKGKDSQYPIPAGGYKFNQESKDVKIEFAKSHDFIANNNLQIEDTFPSSVFPKFAINGSVIIKNNGSVPVEDLTVLVTTSTGKKREFWVDFIPPFGKKEFTVNYSDTPFLTNGDYVIKISAGVSKHTKNVKISLIPDPKIVLIIGGIICVSTITAAVTFHTGSLLVQRRKRKSSIRR